MLNCYGENSFTYMLFASLHRSAGLVDPFLSNLKAFSNGRPLGEANKALAKDLQQSTEDVDVWLFPNFGKAHGFGEPDAILLHAGHSFWFEVETNFDLKKRRISARNSLIQLTRFHYFGQALAPRATTRREGISHLAIMGPTINGQGNVKDAVLRIKGHAVLQKIRGQLAETAQQKKDHYVIFSERKMKGITERESGTAPLRSLFQEVVNQSHDQVMEYAKSVGADEIAPAKPDVRRFWYQYYEGDLSRKLKIDDDGINYVRMSTG